MTIASGVVVPVNETVVVANTAFSSGARIASDRTTGAGATDADCEFSFATAGAGPPPPNPAVTGLNNCNGADGTSGAGGKVADTLSCFGVESSCSRCGAGSFRDSCGTTTSAIGFCALETGISAVGVGSTARATAAPCPASALPCGETVRKTFVIAF